MFVSLLDHVAVCSSSHPQFDLKRLGLAETVEILQQLNQFAEDPFTLRFMYADAVRNEDLEDNFFMNLLEAMTAPPGVQPGSLACNC